MFKKAPKKFIHLTQVVLELLACLDLQGTLDRDGQLYLGLIESAQVKLVDHAALGAFVDRVALDQLGRLSRRAQIRPALSQIQRGRLTPRTRFVGRARRRHVTHHLRGRGGRDLVLARAVLMMMVMLYVRGGHVAAVHIAASHDRRATLWLKGGLALGWRTVRDSHGRLRVIES